MGKWTHLYDAQWRRARDAHLMAHPLCVPCSKAEQVAVATLVHHTVPHRGNLKVFWDQELWEGRCVTCHADAQRVETSCGLRRETYRGCDANGSPLDPGHHWRGGRVGS